MRTFVSTFVYLGAESILDLREKRISLLAAAGYALYVLAASEPEISDMASRGYALLGGGAAVLFSLISRGGFGMGDAIVICTLALMYPADRLLMMTAAAFMICGLFTVVLLLFRKSERGYSLPFVPFLMLGFLYTNWFT